MTEYDIGAAFEAIEDELIASMIRNMDHHRVQEDNEGLQWSMWQAEQLKALEKYKLTNQKKYSKQFKSINSQIGEILHKARQVGNMQQENQILNAIKNGFMGTNKVTQGAAAEFFRLNDRKLEALIQATTHDMEKAETAVLRMADDQYRKAIFNAQVYANSGAGTYEKAVDMATKDMLSRGLTCVEYANGARHTLADYADMAIKTASKRAYLAGEGEKRQEWGIATVIMVKRGNPCPKCLPFCGKVLIDDVWSGGQKSDGPYPLMSKAIAAGLYHPRCKDSHTTYFPGISTADDTWTEKELKAIDQTNKLEAEQQYAERQAEKFSRLSENSIDPQNKYNYKKRFLKWKRQLDKSSNPDIIKTPGWSEKAIEQRRTDEIAIAGNKEEHAILYDSNGNRLFKKQGKADEIEYSYAETLLMGDGVLTHNHPGGGSFSPDDIDMLRHTGLYELRAIGRDGVYVLRRPSAWPEEINTLDKIMKEYSDIQIALEEEMYNEVRCGRITDDRDYSIEYQRRILEQFTSKFNLPYSVEDL